MRPAGGNPPEPAHYPRVLAVEPSKEWWTGNSRFGGRFQNVLPAAEGDIIPLTSLDHAPGPPRSLGINLFREDVAGIADENSDVRARITYGAGGFTNVFEMDWGTGIQFAIVANSVRVDAVTVRRDNRSSYSAGLSKWMLGCTIGIGGGQGLIPAQYSTPITRVATLSNAFVIVPDFARRVTLLATPWDALVTTCFINNNTDGAIIQAPTYRDHYLCCGVVIPMGTQVIDVRNGTAGDLDFQLVYGLAL